MKNPERVAELIAELRTLTETPIERAVVDRCENDLTSPPAAEVIDENTQRFNGLIYRKRQSGHFSNTSLIHKAVWSYYNGEVPAGYQIHHIDHNPANNSIDNFRLMTIAEHTAYHARFTPSKEFICDWCGQKFLSTNQSNNNRFCSTKCRAAWLTKNKLVEKTCPVCGKKFMTPRYKQNKYCSRRCGGILATQDKRKLSDVDRAEIKRIYIKGDREFGIRALARKYGVTHTTIEKVLRKS